MGELSMEEIYQHYVKDVYKFLLYFTGNHQDAEDLTQETFIRVFTKLKQFRYESSIKTWIFSIARNIAVDRLRKRKRLNSIYLLFRNDISINPTIPPEEILNGDETKLDLYSAIQSLKADYKAVIILRGLHEYTPEQVSDILGWNVNRVNVMFHRARKLMLKKLSPEGSGVYLGSGI